MERSNDRSVGEGAMDTGRHVCTEVPAAFSIDECWDLIRAVCTVGLSAVRGH